VTGRSAASGAGRLKTGVGSRKSTPKKASKIKGL
jgi:hypothetical protein